MATFALTVGIDSDAFQGFDADGELSRILRDLADRAEAGHGLADVGSSGAVLDVNGNTVGHWAVTE